MSRRKTEFFALGKIMAPAVAAITIVSLGTMNACTPNDRTTENREAMVQNAQEAEKAEAELAHAASHEEKAAAPVENKVAEKKAPQGHGRSPASIAGGVYVVQVGAFKVKENADKLMAKLKEAGYAVELHSIEHSKNGLLHLVRFAPTKDRSQAESTLHELETKQEMHAQVLTLPAAMN